MNTMQINFRKVHAKELAMMYHRPANIGAVITFVIIYKNLHDHSKQGGRVKPPKPLSPLGQRIAEAKALGMEYGEYMAMRYMKGE